MARGRRGASAAQVAAAILVIVVIAGAAAWWALGRSRSTATTTPAAQSQASTASATPTTSSASTTSAQQATGTNKKIKVLVLFDVGGKGDLSFNDMAILGAERASKDFGVEVKYLTPQSTDVMESLLRSVSKSGQYDLIIGIGFLWLDPMTKVAPEFPNQRYAIIDAAPQKPIKNLAAYVFREQEVAALVGILAADMAHNLGCNKVGAVAGMDIPPLWRFHIGYLYGVKYYDEYTHSNVTLVWTYTGTFTNPQVGKQTAEQMIKNGVCVLYGLAGLTHIGMFDAVKEAAQGGAKVVAIGEDASQEWYDPYHIVLSGLKRVDVAVYDAIKSVVYGNFTGGIHVLGLKNGGLGLSNAEMIKYFAELAAEQGKLPKGLTPDDVVNIVMKEREKLIDQTAWNLVHQLEQEIISGKVKFKTPANHQEYQEIIHQLEEGNLQAALETG
ncbi:MAG: BMP family ABC transporter substrate-binding protein [Desulfurococcales archaeon]|nr:BMP family ABC transporter substrate-binding protein [Desulfurococcales archaeon]